MEKEYKIKEMFYDENGNLNIKTCEGKWFQFSGVSIESIDLGGSLTVSKETFNRDDK